MSFSLMHGNCSYQISSEVILIRLDCASCREWWRMTANQIGRNCCQGRGLVTTLPDFDSPVIVPPGFKQSMVWRRHRVGYCICFQWWFVSRYAIGNALRAFAAPRHWNGTAHYSVAANVPTASPVQYWKQTREIGLLRAEIDITPLLKLVYQLCVNEWHSN